jgi:putative intracellular protease/amidase
LSYNLAYNSNDANKVQEQQGYMKQLGSALTLPMRVEDIDPDRFDLIFLIGGHGPMQDMAVHPTTGAVLVAMLDNPKKLVAAVCHGPAGLLPASRPDGTWALKDRQLTGFSNEEETQAGFAGNAPWPWKIVSVFLVRVTSQKHPGRRMPSPTATSSRVSRTIRPV